MYVYLDFAEITLIIQLQIFFVVILSKEFIKVIKNPVFDLG
jgi:hypothetical protein